MLPKTYDFGIDFFAVVFCAIAVKLVDDFFDRECDKSIGRYNLTQIFGEGSMLYAMFFLALAAGLNNKLSLSLFFASYIVGMFNQLRFIFPSRLSGFGESLVAFLIGLSLFGINYMLFSLCFIVAVQLFDDYADLKKDKDAGQNNFANKFGEIECIILSFIFLFGAVILNDNLIWPVLSGFLIVYFSTQFLAHLKDKEI